MNRTEFITATAVILFAAFVLGWFACWLIHRISRPSRADMSELDRLSQQLHDAEKQRDTALRRLEHAEAGWHRQLTEVEADLERAVTSLAEARAENEKLHTYIERKLAPDEPQ